MDWKLEVVTIPVSDMDRARDFYANQLGFNIDIDHEAPGGVHFLQLTPPGSACSIHPSQSMERAEPGSLEGLFLVVPDVKAAREELAGRGVDAGDVVIYDSGEYRPPREGESLDLVGVFFFSDPDGNRWMVQQIPLKA